MLDESLSEASAGVPGEIEDHAVVAQLRIPASMTGSSRLQRLPRPVGIRVQAVKID